MNLAAKTKERRTILVQQFSLISCKFYFLIFPSEKKKLPLISMNDNGCFLT